jgi:hypothetical protein
MINKHILNGSFCVHGLDRLECYRWSWQSVYVLSYMYVYYKSDIYIYIEFFSKFLEYKQ